MWSATRRENCATHRGTLNYLHNSTLNLSCPKTQSLRIYKILPVLSHLTYHFWFVSETLVCVSDVVTVLNEGCGPGLPVHVDFYWLCLPCTQNTATVGSTGFPFYSAQSLLFQQEKIRQVRPRQWWLIAGRLCRATPRPACGSKQHREWAFGNRSPLAVKASSFPRTAVTGNVINASERSAGLISGAVSRFTWCEHYLFTPNIQRRLEKPYFLSISKACKKKEQNEFDENIWRCF